MSFISYTISQITPLSGGVYIFKLKPTAVASVFDFLPGQFCQLQNPDYKNPEEAHLFSIASSPLDTNYLELCIKVYGFWTQAVAQKKPGDTLKLAGPFGKFIWTNNIKHAIFLAGGIGITPFISMLRYIVRTNQNPAITLLYGSRSEDTIAYKKELESLQKDIKSLKVVHILSDIKKEEIWDGYRGFITYEILKKEINFTLTPDFFLCGPPIFIKLMKEILFKLNINENQIKQELFS